MTNGLPGTRRGFLSHVPAGLVLGRVGAARRRDRLPREVWIASISQEGLHAENPEKMLEAVLARMEETTVYEPDIICTPEVFAFANVASRLNIEAAAEDPAGPVCQALAAFARKHQCYVVCSTYTKQSGKYYNGAVLLDRSGAVVGEYRKIHPTVGEIRKGVFPGPADPPVFRTDFGTIGFQICFDINWPEGWRQLRNRGAEIVFWPSAFAGGSMVNTMAWQNKFCVVSSTRKNTAKLCDISGRQLAATGWYQPWFCAPVNLEKAFVHSWPYNRHFKDIQAKYGRAVSIEVIYEEEWTIMTSWSPDIRIADVLKEYGIPTHEEHIAAAERAQRDCRRTAGCP